MQIVLTGRNPTMRHITRTHGVNSHRLHERHLSGTTQASYIDAKSQAADIFTKAFSSVPTVQHVRALIQIVNPGTDVSHAVLPNRVTPGGSLSGHTGGPTEQNKL